MNELAFNRWLLHTSRDWDDIKDIIYKTYIPVIDRDHKHLARYALDLNLILEKIQREELNLSILKEEKKTLKQFLKYAEEHFEREELIIKHFKLPSEKAQEQDHARTLLKIEELMLNLEKGKIIFTQDNKTELLEWIIEHTNGLDLKTLNLAAFKKHFDKIQSIDDIMMFICFSGEPEVDEALMDFYKIVINKIQSGIREGAQDVLIAYNDFIKIVLSVDKKYQLNLEEILTRKFEQFKPFANLDTDTPLLNGEVLFRFLSFISHEVVERVDIDKWLPYKLKGFKSFEEIEEILQKTGVEEIDESFEKLIRLTFDSYETTLEGDPAKIKSKVTELALSVNQHFIHIEKYSKEHMKQNVKYYTENFKRLRLYLDKAFLHILNDRLEYSISLRDRILFQCIYQNNQNDYVNFKYRPLTVLNEDSK